MLKKIMFCFLFCITLSNYIFAEDSLFDSAMEMSDNSGGKKLSYTINGNLKSAIYSNDSLDDFSNSYSQLSLKFNMKKGEFGDGYANIIIDNKSIILREAYLNYYFKNLDFRIGKQIISWGRSDGINPTDNITPKDLNILSSESDDQKLANFMLKSKISLNNIRIIGLFIPKYSSSPNLKTGEDILEGDYKNYETKALKVNFEFPVVDTSISYVNGYSLNRGIAVDSSKTTPTPILIPYKEEVYGADFSTTIKSYRISGECAYKNYLENEKYYIPYSELEYTLSVDKTFLKSISTIFQYYEKYIDEYKDLKITPYYDVEMRNRLISKQTAKIQNSLLYKIDWSLMYEQLHIENVGSYNLTTKESIFKTKISYNITDDFIAILGNDSYFGDKGTLIDLIKDDLNRNYLELKISF
ncbi:DUF1302 family protein [Haliovirga abyssi]|uniref:DUF3570 domain-containing protein n=1 Tax=Haliovirga abyssi TaxID=2996794 RepID=A0AAU9DYJ6_9FUSO|nr:DUF1302 family protein [Haliovirga abyssi]BDU51601.1 hypothetical protein HLVA_21700 [Haliovirga abyssi]